MMQYFHLRLELFRFVDITELICLTLVWGSPLLLKCVRIHHCWEPKLAKAAKRKDSRNINKYKKKKTISVNKMSHGKNVAHTLDILFLLKMDKADGVVQGNS